MSRAATKRAHFDEVEDDDEKMVDEVQDGEEEEGEEEEGEEEEGEEEEGEEEATEEGMEDGEGAGDAAAAAAAAASTTVAAAPAAASFEALGLDLRLLKAVRKLGLARPTAVQARQHGQSAPLGSAPARPLHLFGVRLAALGSLREARPLGSRPLPRVLERAASSVADPAALNPSSLG